MKITRRQLREILGDFIDYGYDDNYESYYPSDYFHYNDILKFMHMNGEDASNPKVSYTEEELAQYKPLLKRQRSRLILLDKLDKNGHYDKYITYLYNQITNQAEIMQRRDQIAVRENKMKITKRQLRRIIKEAMGAQIGANTGRVAKSMAGGQLPLSRKAKQWLSWGEGYGLNPEEDNEGQLLFFFDLNDDVDGSIAREAERMGGDLQPAGQVPDGNMVIYTGEYTSEISLGGELR